MLIALCGAYPHASGGSYLFMWAGDAAGKASDFLAVIDASPASPRYGAVIASLATGTAGTHPHHTEHEMPANGHLLANGFHAGRTWLFDLSNPLTPRIITSFGDVAGFSHPHSFIRLATAVYWRRSSIGRSPGPNRAAADTIRRGTPSIARPAVSWKWTNGAVDPILQRQRSGDQGPADLSIQRAPDAGLRSCGLDNHRHGRSQQGSDVGVGSVLAAVATQAAAEHRPAARPSRRRTPVHRRAAPVARWKSVYIHTFNCGLYLLRDVERPEPKASFVTAFKGKNCGVPVLTGQYWIQTVPEAHAVVALDITNPERPREVSTLAVGEDEEPHWISIDSTGRRIVLNSSGSGTGNRLFVIDFDPANGRLSFDERFRDEGSSRPGIRLTGRAWPHGFTGTPVPHGTVFSR